MAVFATFASVEACEDGYAMTGGSCQDIDECSDGTENCEANRRCLNTPGSFFCRRTDAQSAWSRSEKRAFRSAKRQIRQAANAAEAAERAAERAERAAERAAEAAANAQPVQPVVSGNGYGYGNGNGYGYGHGGK